MKSLSETLYLKLPPIMQNILISFYGLKEQHIRYSGIYNSYSRSIESNLALNSSNLITYQTQMLRSIIQSAWNVPYYLPIFTNLGIPKADIFELHDLQSIPLIDKSVLRINPDNFVNTKFYKHTFAIHTTGSTGTPLKISCTPKVRQKNYAFFNRFLHSVGLNPYGSKATIGGRILSNSQNNKPPYWRYSFFQKNLYLSSYHLTESNIIYYIDKLKSFCPSYIDCYPSSIYVIADYAKRKNISLSGITQAIITSAETLFPHQRSVIETQFDAPVFDQYGAAEMCVFASQCKQGNYHLHTDYSIVEFLKEDGSNAQPGDEAELVCTSLINPVMPLIRYRIGDKATYSDKQCTCGCHFPVIENLLGRTDDIIITPDGRNVGRLSPVLKGFPVREAQYIQKVLSEIEVFIVKDSGYLPETEHHIINELRKRLGPIINIKIIPVDSLTRGKGGKTRTVISLINKSNYQNAKN